MNTNGILTLSNSHLSNINTLAELPLIYSLGSFLKYLL